MSKQARAYTVNMYSISRTTDTLGEPLLLPMAVHAARAGFPSPAEDLGAERIDITSVLITHPQATFFTRVKGDSMVDDGIFDGDILVVNRAIRPAHGHIICASIDNGELIVKRLHKQYGRLKLVSSNPTYPPIVPKEGETVDLWGVVTASIKQFRV